MVNLTTQLDYLKKRGCLKTRFDQWSNRVLRQPRFFNHEVV